MKAHAEYHENIANMTKESEVYSRESLAMKRCAEKNLELPIEICGFGQ